MPCVLSSSIYCTIMDVTGGNNEVTKETRACLKIVNTPNRRAFCRHASPIFLTIHPVFRRKNVFVWRQNPSPLYIFPFFKQGLSIIVPVYYNAETLRATYQDIEKGIIDQVDFECEIIFVNDGSGDDSWDIIQELKAEHREYVRAIKLSRNFGSQYAVLCGFKNATGDCVTIKAADRQEPIQLILSNLLLLLWVNLLHINQFIAPLITITITMPLNFIIQKLRIYKSK